VIHDHARDGVPGAFTVIGVKYTTARAVAERAVAQVAARLGKPLGPSRSAERVLPGGSLAAGADPLRETSRDLTLEAPIAEHLVRRYRDRAPDIVRLALDRPALAAPLGAEIATIGAEVIHAIRHEMAQHLTDIVIRRTALGAARHPGQDAVRACARVAAAEAGWDEARVRAEIAAVDAFYAIEDE
jgi:glycerol-3-phosphate dehydrogenase